MSSEKSFWDKYAKVYDLFISKDKKAYENIYLSIRENLNKDMKVLEVCTGTGIIARNICNDTKGLIAVDYSNEMINLAKKKSYGKDINYMIKNAYNMDFEDDSFDTVIIMNSLHILKSPHLVLNEIKRVLKEDGLLIAPNFTHKYSLNKMLLLSKLTGFKVYKVWGMLEYVDFIEKSGFKVIKSKMFKSSYPITYVEAKSN
ncbi:MAG TPA: methyltransferase domain-containing protein [Anaerovoracaceae bacterium]|nr:methyltransferase domain-containing protein [Anaerovoracaceae bacterium]